MSKDKDWSRKQAAFEKTVEHYKRTTGCSDRVATREVAKHLNKVTNQRG